MKKAEKLGVRIISEQEFIAMLGGDASSQDAAEKAEQGTLF